MSEQENLDVLRQQIEAMNAGDAARYSNLFSEDCVLESDVWGGQLQGREAAAQIIQGYIDAFSPKVEIQQEIASGDTVVNVFSYSGTHVGEFAGVAPTGNAVSGTVVTVSELSDGQIQRQLTAFDNATLLSQVGVELPTGAQTTG